MSKTTLELEAENYENNLKCNSSISFEEAIYTKLSDAYIAGATSDAAKQYWYKQFEKQKLEFTIKELMWVNILIPFEHQYAKDCIDNKIKELEQKLCEL